MKLFCINIIFVKMALWFERTLYSLWALGNWRHSIAIGLVQTSWKASCYFLEGLHLHGQPSTLKPEVRGFSKMLMLHIQDYMLLHPEDGNLHIHCHENLVYICSCSFYTPAFHYFFLGLNSLSTLFLNDFITCEVWDSSDDECKFYWFEWW